MPSPVQTRRALIASSALLLCGLSGCVVAPLGSAYPYQSVEGPVVDAAPPPAQAEYMPPAPGVGYVWIGGHWGWNLGRHTWIGGRWAVPPRGYGWAPGYWGRQGPRWRWHGGHWRRR